jgi:5-hydroxyisourate hydrolase
MGHLTTHVLDISAGSPAAGVRIEVQSAAAGASPGGRAHFGGPSVLARVATGKDGRCPAPLLAGDEFRAGRYVLTFYLADYFRGLGVVLPEPAFLEEAVLRIGIAHPDQHYHVPLLISPWSYSVYRGG